MNRDMDIVRQIVLALQAATEPLSAVAGVADEAFKINGQYIIEAKLAEGTVAELNNSVIPAVVVLWRLTWDGCDFADSIGDDTLWKKAKEVVIKPAGSWTFGLLRAWLKAELKRRFGIDAE